MSKRLFGGRNGDAMDSYLSRLGLMRRKIPKDSLSLFRAVSEQLFHSQRLTPEIEGLCVGLLSRSNITRSVNRIKNLLFAISTMFRRDMVIYRDIGKSPENPTGNRFAEKIILVESYGGHFDTLQNKTQCQVLGVCQSIVYTLLMERVLGIDSPHLQTAVDNLRKVALPHIKKQNRKDFRKAKLNTLLNYVDDNHDTAASWNELALGCGLHPCITYSTAVSLEPNIYRNIAYDLWLTGKKAELHGDLRLLKGSQCFVNVGGNLVAGVIEGDGSKPNTLKVLIGSDNLEDVAVGDVHEMASDPFSDESNTPKPLYRRKQRTKTSGRRSSRDTVDGEDNNKEGVLGSSATTEDESPDTFNNARVVNRMSAVYTGSAIIMHQRQAYSQPQIILKEVSPYEDYVCVAPNIGVNGCMPYPFMVPVGSQSEGPIVFGSPSNASPHIFSPQDTNVGPAPGMVDSGIHYAYAPYFRSGTCNEMISSEEQTDISTRQGCDSNGYHVNQASSPRPIHYETEYDTSAINHQSGSVNIAPNSPTQFVDLQSASDRTIPQPLVIPLQPSLMTQHMTVPSFMPPNTLQPQQPRMAVAQPSIMLTPPSPVPMMHPQSPICLQPPTTLPQSPMMHPQSPMMHPQSQFMHPQSPMMHPQPPMMHPPSPLMYPQPPMMHPQPPMNHPQPPMVHPHSPVRPLPTLVFMGPPPPLGTVMQNIGGKNGYYNGNEGVYTTPQFNYPTPINFNVSLSTQINGADLPLNDISTLRYFFNVGLEHWMRNMFHYPDNLQSHTNRPFVDNVTYVMGDCFDGRV